MLNRYRWFRGSVTLAKPQLTMSLLDFWIFHTGTYGTIGCMRISWWMIWLHVFLVQLIYAEFLASFSKSVFPATGRMHEVKRTEIGYGVMFYLLFFPFSISTINVKRGNLLFFHANNNLFQLQKAWHLLLYRYIALKITLIAFKFVILWL